MDDNKKTNERVPMAIVSCFLIAFISQGVLKLCGVLVFEKALNWDVFRIIDKYKFLQIVYYSMINLISMYCLSFALTTKPYSKKWYHYIIIVVGAFVVTTCRMLLKTSLCLEFIYDCIMYITIPIVISLTTDKTHKLFEINNLSNIIVITSIHILLYFCYLGLNYWSNLLNSLIPIKQTILYASSNFLIIFETYIGLILLMISMNVCINNFKNKGGIIMNWPMNIASTLAKKRAKRDKLAEELSKLDKEIEELEKKQTSK